jgi:hypothetical protein
MALGAYIYSNASAENRTPTSVAGPVGPAGVAGVAGVVKPADVQALAIAIASAESATALALQKAQSAEISRIAADLAKNDALEATQTAKTSTATLLAELAALKKKSNSIKVTRGATTSKIGLNLSDDFAAGQGTVQIKRPGSKSYLSLGKVNLNKSGDGLLKIKGLIKSGSTIRVLVDGVVVKSILYKT